MNYQDFSFSLNVYSHILLLDCGALQYLHYGMFELGDDPMLAAQQRASQQLFSCLPVRPSNILEVGIGSGKTLDALTKAGHQATGMSPDASQIRFAKDRHGAGLPAVCARLEDFGNGETFDLLRFPETAQYVDTATLFRKMHDLLSPDGEVLIMDEMSMRRTDEPGLPYCDEYVAKAGAFGFDLAQVLDLSQQAAPTNAYVVDAVTRHRSRLINELDLTSAHIDGLLVSARQYEEKYTDGRYGYALLHFKKT